MKDCKLDNTKLVVLQGMNNESVDISSIQAMVMEDFYKNSEQRLVEQKQQISSFTGKELGAVSNTMVETEKIIPELESAILPKVSFHFSYTQTDPVDSVRIDAVRLLS